MKRIVASEWQGIDDALQLTVSPTGQTVQLNLRVIKGNINIFGVEEDGQLCLLDVADLLRS